MALPRGFRFYLPACTEPVEVWGRLELFYAIPGGAK